jgi:serine/threonine protein kinase
MIAHTTAVHSPILLISLGGMIMVIYVYVCNDGVNRCSLLLDVASGLQHMHRHHVLHRDIKSHNILLVPSSSTTTTLPSAKGMVVDDGSSSSIIPSLAVGGFTAKITDFGSSLLLSSADDYVLDDPVGRLSI